MMQAGARPTLSATSGPHWYFTDGTLAYNSLVTEIRLSISAGEEGVFPQGTFAVSASISLRADLSFFRLRLCASPAGQFVLTSTPAALHVVGLAQTAMS